MQKQIKKVNFVQIVLCTNSFKYQFLRILSLSIKLNNMGNCTVTKEKQRKILPLHLRTPDDLQLYNPKVNLNLEKHSFECQLYNVKLVGSIEKQVKIIFNIPGMIELIFPKKSAETSSQQIQWKNRGKFNIRGNDYQIRTNFIQVELFNGQNTKIGHLQINSYQIMNGPSHNDFRISLKNKKQARLIFELKISQVIQVEIESMKTEVQFNRQYPGEKFYYTIRAMVNPSAKRPISEMDLNSTSFPSYTQEVPLISSNEFQTIDDSLDCNMSLRLKKKHSTFMPIEINSKLTWSKTQCSQMPAFKIRMLSTELLHSQFKMNIWKVTEVNKQQSIQNFGQMTIFLNPLMEQLPIEREINKKKILERLATFNGEIVSSHNIEKKIGKCCIQFKIKNSQFVAQKIGCTMTEDGIINMSHNEIYSTSKNITNNHFKEICKKFDQFMQKYVDLNSNQTKGKNWNAYSNMKKALKQLASLLHENHKKSHAYYTESQLAQFEQRQTTLLKIATQIKQVIQQNNQIADLCWRIEVFIFRRGELLLKNLGFRPDQKEKLKKNGLDSSINSKMIICLQYQQVIYSLLELSLSSSHRMKSYASLDDDYSEIFKAYCYLSVPIFREKLLKILTKKPKRSKHQDNKQNGDKEFLEMKMTRNKQQLKASTIRQNIMSAFDYEENLYKWIRKNSKSELRNNDLIEKMDEYEAVITNMIENTPEFFSFVKTFMKELQRNEDLKNLPFWQYIPGYNKIVQKIYTEMNKAPLENYFGDEGVGQVSMCLLTNPNLFQPFLHIIFQKTNVYNQSSVMQMLSIVNQYVHFMIKIDKLISSFPYHYLMKGFKLLLQGDSVAVITKTIVFLYNIFDHIGTQFKQSLIMYFLGKVFNFFFYHWAYNVRNTFHHLFIEKFSQCQQLIALPQIKSRYETILSMIANAQQAQHRQSLRVKNQPKYLHESMRQKFNKIKKISQNRKNRPRRLSDELALQKLQGSVIGKNIQISTLKDIIKEQQKQDEMVVVKLKKKMTYFETNKITDITNKPKQLSEQQPALYKSQQYQLKQLLENQVAYILQATKQFHEINKNLRLYMQREKKLPNIKLDFQISMDQKDIKPNLAL